MHSSSIRNTPAGDNFASPSEEVSNVSYHQLVNPSVQEVPPEAHAVDLGRPEPTFVDHVMETIGDPLKTGKKLIEYVRNVSDPLRSCREGAHSFAEAIQNLIQTAVGGSYYTTDPVILENLLSLHLARESEFYEVDEGHLYHELKGALEDALAHPKSNQQHLWGLVDEVLRRVPEEVIELQPSLYSVETEDTTVFDTRQGLPQAEITIFNSEQPSEVIHSSQFTWDHYPKEPQARYNNLYQLKTLYLGMLQKTSEGTRLHEECKRLTDHCEAILAKNTHITEHDYQTLIAHKNWFRNWVTTSSEITEGASYLPNEDFSAPKATLVDYNTSQPPLS